MIFGKEYYDEVWGGGHRHDYCPYWADRLVQEHGVCRILDIGCSCGYLVKLLRERGCDAWGVDSSEYAIVNTCAPGYVLKASVADLPFKDDLFDVVFSNGLWEYLTLDEIAKGAQEIWRVGRKQIHNIDHDACDFREDFVTWKPQAWWDEQLSEPKVLISCPTHESKEYAHKAWIDAVQAIDYPNFEIFVVDNSATRDCCERWQDKIPMMWLGSQPTRLPLQEMDMAQRMGASMEIARQKFLKGNYKWWLNVEIDIIPEPSVLKTLIKYGRDTDWTAHCYPARGETEQCCSGLGCALWSRRLIEAFEFGTAGDTANHGVDSFMWNWVRPKREFTTLEMWSHVRIDHLRSPDG